jgi:hypothetical protein
MLMGDGGKIALSVGSIVDARRPLSPAGSRNFGAPVLLPAFFVC